MSGLKFTLTESQVPEVPWSADGTMTWADALRWLVCVMDPLDSRLGFIAGCLSYELKQGALTPKQAAACKRITEAILADFHDGILVCQNQPDNDENDFTGTDAQSPANRKDLH